MARKIGVLTFSCAAAFAFFGCTKTKNSGKKETVTEVSCLAKGMGFNSTKKICAVPEEGFCARNKMVLGIGRCNSPRSQSDCNRIGNIVNKKYTYRLGECQGGVGEDPTMLDKSIKITFTGKTSIPFSPQQFVEIGKTTVKLSGNDLHQVNLLPENSPACELTHRIDPANASAFVVLAKTTKRPPATCTGKILIFSKTTGKYNVEELSVPIN